MVQASEVFYQIVDGAKHAKDVVDGHLQKVDPLVLVIGAIGGTVVYLKVSKLYAASDRPLHKRLAGYLFQQLRRLPSVKAKVDEELSGARKDIQHTVLKYEPEGVGAITAIPPNGMTDEQVLALASEYNDFGTFDVADGKVSGAVYTDRSDEHIKLLGKIYEQYAYSNPLHPDVFPGVRKMEAEVIRMVLNLYHAPEDSAGSLTTGGTESIIMACFAYRNMAMERGVESPVILCSETAHAAFDKAADLCGMRIRHVPVDENNRVQLKKMEQMIGSDVCMLVGSAPNFPTGTVDPISDIAKLGEKYGIPVHVDACLGGFMIPFMNEAGFHLNTFDFRNPGVTSISCDTHKYGCTPKGSSVVMYRSKQLHHYQYFAVPEWTGGIYATPTICGSRAGANAAVAWATLCRFGRTEYVQRARAIVEQTRRLAEGVKKIEGLELHGSPDVSIVAFKSKDNVFNIYAVSDKLNKMGYNLNTLQNPDAVHVCLTYNHARPEVVDQLLVDIAGAVKEVLASEDKGHKSATAALYGMAAQIPDKTLVNEMAFEFLDACYVAKKN